MGEVRKDKPIKLPPSPCATEPGTYPPPDYRRASERAAIRAAIAFCVAMAAWVFLLTR